MPVAERLAHRDDVWDHIVKLESPEALTHAAQTDLHLPFPVIDRRVNDG
jgi:hypothetical protein